jgi:hypothetical protein
VMKLNDFYDMTIQFLYEITYKTLPSGLIICNRIYSHIYPPYEMSIRWGTMNVPLVEGNFIVLKVHYVHSPLMLPYLTFFARFYI